MAQRIDFDPFVIKQRFHKSSVRALETHDRLFEVTDNQRSHATRNDMPQQRKLDRIGILELVDNDAVDTTGKGVAGFRMLAKQCFGLHDHVRIIEQLEAALCFGIAFEDGLDPTDQRRGVILRVFQWAIELWKY